MKEFDVSTFNLSTAQQELEAFRVFLEKEELDEEDDILPFFRKHIILSCMIGTVVNLGYFDKYSFAYEFPIHGDFRCDLVVGDSKKNQYLLVEFEDAKENSIFCKKKNKATKVWASRFEEGYSQIVDWFWRIGIMSSEERELFFESPSDDCLEYHGLLIIGRKRFLAEKEKKRLIWRRKNTAIATKYIKCMTYDDLYEALKGYVESLKSLATQKEVE
ncbi:Shedu anti-phage system protein SduA domain-containing protein [Bacillus mobilis]|uniref:Shedu anti-phage system protein SduA domain-containing protein n=1 Tax=Bacillus mobilis TaxID=2026190 RepID=UPI002E1FFB84|nr:DUF4263 domain-containing protein [Bacillus mobilis]